MSQLQLLIELQKNVTCQIEKTKFESRSEPEVFSGLCSSSGTVGSISAALSCLVWGRNAGSFPEQRLVIEPSVSAALALMTVITQLLLWSKLISLFTILGPRITSTKG